MTIKMTTRGLSRLQKKLLNPPRPTAQAIRDKADKRFVKAMKRRPIPSRSGRLKASLVKRAHRDHLARLSGQRIELGTRVPYGRYQKRAIKPLTRQERNHIFMEPLKAILQTWKRGEGSGQGVTL